MTSQDDFQGLCKPAQRTKSFNIVQRYLSIDLKPKTMKDDEKNSNRALKSILKMMGIGIIISLSILGVAFLVLITYITFFDTGTSHSKQNYAIRELSRIDKSLEDYRLDINSYPSSLLELVEDDETNSMWMGPYLRNKLLKDPWNQNYHYQYFPDRKGYQLYTLGSDHTIGGDGEAKDRISEKSLMLINPNQPHKLRINYRE